MPLSLILTHPGGAHKDEFLACAVLLAIHPTEIVRREPTEADLADDTIAVVDVGGEHAPGRMNFDHHQFPADHPPQCALSLVLQHLGIYGDAKVFCDWLEPAEWFDVLGPTETARRLGVDRPTLSKLSSPVDVTLLRRFAAAKGIRPGEVLWELMRMIGQDLLDYVRGLRHRLDFIGRHAELWTLEGGLKVLFMPRTEPLPDEPSSGLPRYLDLKGWSTDVKALIYPDRRGTGYGLSRHNDSPLFDFTRIEKEGDVHFAHARGFVAKTSATDRRRLKALLEASRVKSDFVAPSV